MSDAARREEAEGIWIKCFGELAQSYVGRPFEEMKQGHISLIAAALSSRDAVIVRLAKALLNILGKDGEMYDIKLSENAILDPLVRKLMEDGKS